MRCNSAPEIHINDLQLLCGVKFTVLVLRKLQELIQVSI